MSNPIYLRAACFFITNEEVRNVTSAVLIDCLSGGGGAKGKKKFDFHHFSVCFVYILRSS